MTGPLQALAADLRDGRPPAVIRAARRAHTLAFLALAAPGLPLGGLYLLTRPAPVPVGAVLALAVLGAGFAAVAFRLAGRAARDPLLPPTRAALTAAMQAASAPGVPFLLGCALLHDLLGAALLWGVALAAFLLGRAWLPGWVRSRLSPGH